MNRIAVAPPTITFVARLLSTSRRDRADFDGKELEPQEAAPPGGQNRRDRPAAAGWWEKGRSQ
jgi:hypothetical protein